MEKNFDRPIANLLEKEDIYDRMHSSKNFSKAFELICVTILI